MALWSAFETSVADICSRRKTLSSGNRFNNWNVHSIPFAGFTASKLSFPFFLELTEATLEFTKYSEFKYSDSGCDLRIIIWSRNVRVHSDCNAYITFGKKPSIPSNGKDSDSKKLSTDSHKKTQRLEPLKF